MNRRRLLILVTLGAAVGLWHFFRPERLFVNRTVTEAFPAGAAPGADSAATPVLRGAFHGNAHDTKGAAAIYRLADGQLLLRLTGFETSNGPDVQVYLVAAADVNDDETVKRAGFVTLGPLKGNIGDQNYAIPSGTDLAKYRAVTIWCRRFSVNFGTAPLS